HALFTSSLRPPSATLLPYTTLFRSTTEIREGVSGIFREDELILEAQQRAMDENPGRVFYNLNIDAGAMWARRIIDRMIARETPRSEEHTSELQSHLNLVCCLLLATK